MRKVLFLAVGFAGCLQPLQAPTGPDKVIPVVAAASSALLGTAPVRRLTSAEYNATVHDLLGDTTQPASAFTSDGTVGLFFANSSSPVGFQTASDYSAAATTLAATAVQNLSTLMGCDPTTNETTCVQSFIATFGARAFRRPVTAAEATALYTVYESVRSGAGTPAAAVQLLVQTFLISPQFLYHLELGTQTSTANEYALNGYELAARLSYFLWGSMPDDALFAAAKAGELETADGIETQARRMLKDARAKTGLGNFFSQWLIDTTRLASAAPSATLYPTLSTNIKADAVAETNAFIEDVLFIGDHRWDTLMTAPYTFVNADTASSVYGLSGVTGNAMQKVQLDATQRGGFLTQTAFMLAESHADSTDPVHRGKYVRERLLCGHLSPPPANLPGANTTPVVTANETVRQEMSAHESTAVCASCHLFMDPIGLGFEEFDEIGKWVKSGANASLDVTGYIKPNATSDYAQIDINGTVDLEGKLLANDDVSACIAKQMITYAIGDDATAETDNTKFQSIIDAYNKHDHDLFEVFVAVTRSDSFRYRQSTEAAGVCQ